MAVGSEVYCSVIETVLRDNNRLTNTTNTSDVDTSFIQSTNDEIKKLGVKNLKLSWTGDFELLQYIVRDFMKFGGKWNSPGGEKKVCSDGDTSIIWWKRKKFLLVEGKHADRLIELFVMILTNNATPFSPDKPGNINKDLSQPEEGNLINSCSCKCNSLAVDIEELKLDNVVLESRMEHKTNTNTETINNLQQDILKLQSMCDMLAGRVGNIDETSHERERNVISNLESQNKFLTAEVKTLNHKLENLEKKTKAGEVMNTHANTIPSNKDTYVDNSKLAVNDTDQINIISPDNDFNRKQQNGTKEGHQLVDESINLEQLRSITIADGDYSLVSNAITVPCVTEPTNTNQSTQNSYNNSHIFNLIANDEPTPVKITDCNNTYAEVAARQTTPPTKINRHMVNPKNTPSNHELPVNIDDGFKGVERKRNRVKRFFLSGIAKCVTETNIRAYLEKRNVKPTQISIFKSRREGTVSAKINILAGDAKLVNTNEFLPRFVQCKPWQPTYEKQGFDRRGNTTLKGYQNGTFV